MIIIFGAPGAGKSLQGQMLAARHGWRWVSAGQMLRDTKDPQIIEQMSTGKLIDDDLTNSLVTEVLASAGDVDRVVLDGFPRHLPQAKWLLNNQPHGGRPVGLVIVLEVPDDEILQRLKLRGRPDDKPTTAIERLKIYRDEVRPVIDYFKQKKVPVVHVSGLGTVGEVHDRIESELKTWQLL